MTELDQLYKRVIKRPLDSRGKPLVVSDRRFEILLADFAGIKDGWGRPFTRILTRVGKELVLVEFGSPVSNFLLAGIEVWRASDASRTALFTRDRAA